ncbi:MAG: MBL fold metallo-hydrolase, partial [Myxococcales bacterium]|nr:MBL fold metallo-hydrolase [Myxococcales bacterium]
MKLTIVGSADAFHSAGRGHSCYWLEAGGAGSVMIDFGATALYGLRRLGRDPNDLDGLLFTHLHGDHIGGWPYLYLSALFHRRRTRPLHVLGPRGIGERLNRLLDLLYPGVREHEAPFIVSIEEVDPMDRRSVCGWTVGAYAADHVDPPEQALCLRVEGPDGRSVAFSGDT